jgi:hypothetical protein
MKSAAFQNFLAECHKKHASMKIVLLFGLGYIINQIVIMSILSTLGHETLFLQLTFSKNVFADIITKWGKEGLQIYETHYYFDFPHAFIYSIFLSSALAYLTYKPDKKTKKFTLSIFTFPYIAGTCDVIENILHLIIIPNLAGIPKIFIILSATMTHIKWIFAGVSILFIIFYYIAKE